MQTIRKKIKKLDKQEPYESRVVWRHLTESLERGDKEAAAEAKHTVRSMVYAHTCLLYTSPSPRDATLSRMPSSA